jgi:SAM-dependent methyltransferase
MHEVRETFADLEAWRGFKHRNAWVSDPTFIASIGENARANGVNSRLLGHAGATEVFLAESNLRESIVARGVSSRVRAVLDELFEFDASARILMLEDVTPFAEHVRERFPLALGTEYLPTNEARTRFPNTRHLDITNADLPSASFDAIVSNDVMEHVPDLDRALSEMRRLLCDGGLCIATFPFVEETIVRARLLADGSIEHLLPPEYHGDPVRAEGALVFAIPGWDVLGRARAAGFAAARMLFVSSIPRGITGNQTAGVFILHATA